MKYAQMATVKIGVALTLLCGTATAESLSAALQAEGAVSLANAAREVGSAVRGAILFPQQEIGCANCHASGGQNLLGPDLTRIDPEATDTYLVEAMLDPSKVIKKGFESVTVITVAGKSFTGRMVDETPDEITIRDASADRRLVRFPRTDVDQIVSNAKSTMPDGLVNLLADRQQFLDLLKYLMEIRAAGPSLDTGTSSRSSLGSDLTEELRGLVLLDDFKCASCHRDAVVKNLIPPKQAPDLAWGSGRIDPHFVEQFIADPLRVKPKTTMPDLMGTMNAAARRAVAREITQYLVSLGNTTFQRQPLDPAAADRGDRLFHSVGCVACHSPRTDDGTERLTTDSVPLGKLEQKYNVDGLAAFLENPHAVRPSGRMPNMQLSHWEATDIAHYLLSTGDVDSPVTPFVSDQTTVVKGKAQFHRLGCAQCHKIDTQHSERDYPLITNHRDDSGCLSERVGAWPRYDLDDAQRNAMRVAIHRLPTELTEQQQIVLTLSTFNCIACHQREDLDGTSPERSEYFQTTNPNLGPQGRIPPPLTGVGAKLKAKWMRQVLVSGRAIRPYMKTRMPQFGTDNVVHLVELFQRVDQLPEIAFAEFPDSKEIRDAGHQMAGVGGLNCIACHTFQRRPAATMPAVDLTEMAERLHKNWFYRYMRDPQRLSANTVMPSFWPSGRAIRKDVLDGDTNLQIEALWQYLLEGRQARVPRGLVREPIELLATNEAVMLRRSYPGIGKRGIGVGYPGQVNLAFDAEQMRLAMMWKGKFADPSGVWTSQGHGTVRPIGKDRIQFAAGPDLDDAENPWPVDEGRPVQHQFKGYDLDELQRPIFRYLFDHVEVEDYPIDAKDNASGAVMIRRTLTFTSKRIRKHVAFRVATDASIVSEESGVFQVGKSLRIRVDDQHEGQIIDTPAGQQLRVPLEIPSGQSQLVIEYEW